MVFSGVAGSRPARELCLADGYGKGTVKGPIAFSSESLPAPDAGWVRVLVKKTRQNKEKGPDSEPVGGYDNASISASLRSPETIMIGIGNEPTAWAIAVISGPGPSGPGLAANTSIVMSVSLSMTSRICSVGAPPRIHPPRLV